MHFKITFKHSPIPSQAFQNSHSLNSPVPKALLWLKTHSKHILSTQGQRRRVSQTSLLTELGRDASWNRHLDLMGGGIHLSSNLVFCMQRSAQTQEGKIVNLVTSTS